MPRVIEEALDEALATTEGGDRLPDGRFKELGDFVKVAGHLEAATATPVGRLNGNRQAVFLRERDDLVGPTDRVLGSGNQGSIGGERDVARLDLVAEGVDGFGARPNPNQARVDDSLRESGVLGKEPIPRVHGVSTSLLGDVEELVLAQVGVARCAAAEGIRLVGHLHMEGVPVGVGIDGDRAETSVLAGAGDADGNFAAVGNEHLGDRHDSEPSA